MSNITAILIELLLFPPNAQSPFQLHIELLPIKKRVDRKLHSGGDLGVKELRRGILYLDRMNGIQSPRNNGTLNPIPKWRPQNPIIIRKTALTLCAVVEKV